MKTLKNIDDKLEPLDENLSSELRANLPTYRKMFRTAIGTGLAKDGEHAFDLFQIGLKFKLDGADLSIEDAEFKLLKERCIQNTPQWQAHYHGQVMLKLKEADSK